MQELLMKERQGIPTLPEVLPGYTRVYPHKDIDPNEYVDIQDTLLEQVRDLLKRNPDHADHVHDIFEDAESIAGANCHKTALYLTGHITRDELFAHTNHDVSTAGHAYVVSQERTRILPSVSTNNERTLKVFLKQLYSEFKKRTPPFRITFFSQEKGGVFPQHSITVLAESNRGHWYGFEKKDAYGDHPFQDVLIEEALLRYLVNGHRIGIEHVAE